MLIAKDRQISLMILYAIIMHYTWSICLALDPSASGATALGVFVTLLHMPVWLMVWLFSFVATLSVLAMTSPTIDMYAILLMLPQQTTLMISAYGALHAVWLARFGDGVVRSHAFILSDQIGAVTAAAMHTLAIIGMGQRWKR